MCLSGLNTSQDMVFILYTSFWNSTRVDGNRFSFKQELKEKKQPECVPACWWLACSACPSCSWSEWRAAGTDVSVAGRDWCALFSCRLRAPAPAATRRILCRWLQHAIRTAALNWLIHIVCHLSLYLRLPTSWRVSLLSCYHNNIVSDIVLIDGRNLASILNLNDEFNFR